MGGVRSGEVVGARGDDGAGARGGQVGRGVV